jgi:hypothetical protein
MNDNQQPKLFRKKNLLKHASSEHNNTDGNKLKKSEYMLIAADEYASG